MRRVVASIFSPFSWLGIVRQLTTDSQAEIVNSDVYPGPDAEALYRIKRLIGNHPQIVYVDIAGDGVVPDDLRTSGKDVLTSLAALHIWQDTTWRYLRLQSENGMVHIWTGGDEFLGVPEKYLLGHLPRFNMLELVPLEEWKPEVQRVRIEGADFVLKFEPLPHHVFHIIHEILVYHEFLARKVAHVPTIKGYAYEGKPSRVIGFLYEYIDARPATLDDFAACESAVRHLHRSSIYHGDIRPYNILVRPTNEVMMIDFSSTLIGGAQLHEAISVDADTLKSKMDEEYDSLHANLSNRKRGNILHRVFQ